MSKANSPTAVIYKVLSGGSTGKKDDKLGLAQSSAGCGQGFGNKVDDLVDGGSSSVQNQCLSYAVLGRVSDLKRKIHGLCALVVFIAVLLVVVFALQVKNEVSLANVYQETKVVEAAVTKNDSSRSSQRTRVLAKMPDWYMARNNYIYRIFGMNFNYTEAEMHCATLGARLASLGIRNSTTRREIRDALLLGYGVVWIGLEKLPGERVWDWSDGTTSKQREISWAPGEPNNAGLAEDCVNFFPRAKSPFNDDGCHKRFPFLCERPLGV